MALSKYKTRFRLTKVASNQPESQEMLTVEDLDTLYEALEMLRNYCRDAYDDSSDYRQVTVRRCADLQAILYRMGD